MIHTRETIAEFREVFYALVSDAQSIAITAHISPDDDSIASVLSVYSLLIKKFPHKKIQILYTGKIVDKYKIFSSFEQITFVDDIAHHIKDLDALLLLDCSKFSRTSNEPDILTKVPVSICIDHHASVPDEFTLALIDPVFSSNAELVYTALEAEQYLDASLAELFLLGILGDTGNLTHIDTHQTEVFSIVKKLVEVGNIRIDSFMSQYRYIPKHIVPLLQEFVKNTTYVEISGWPSLQYSFVDRSFMAAHNFSDEDMSAASHIYIGQYLPRVEGQSWGLVFSPRQDGGVRMSSRSLHGSVNVRLLCEALGVGGGHDRASGANFKSTDGVPVVVQDAIERVFDFMKNNQPVLS